MRAVTWFFLTFSLAIFAVVFSDHPSSAQTKPADESKPPQTLTGPGGSEKQASPAGAAKPTEPRAAESKAAPASGDAAKSTPDKSEQDKSAKDDKAANAKKPAGRVGTLSPGEARRAARARDRAASARRDRSPQKTAQPDAPASVVTKEGRPSEKTAKTTDRPSQHDARAPERRRTASEKYSRPTRERDYAPRPRRNYAGPGRVPRAGDVVPPGYPLYPMPPRGAGYYEVDGGPPRGWRALPPPPRGYPPFPRIHFGFDDPEDD